MTIDDNDYTKLLTALGSENEPGQWFVFVKTVKEILPFVSVGRPSYELVEPSVIGRKGFASWKVMVAAPKEDGGFNTPYNTWKKWSEAAEFIFKHPYLEQLRLKQGGIKRLRDKFNAADIEFPTSIDELEDAERQHAEYLAQSKAIDIKALKDNIVALEQQLLAANAKVQVFENQTNDASEKQLTIVRENVALSAKLEELVRQSQVVAEQQLEVQRENEKLSAQLKESMQENKHLKTMGRLSHLAKFFTG